MTGAERVERLELLRDTITAAQLDLHVAAVQAVHAGLPKAAVARAAGVARSTLDRWVED